MLKRVIHALPMKGCEFICSSGACRLFFSGRLATFAAGRICLFTGTRWQVRQTVTVVPGRAGFAVDGWTNTRILTILSRKGSLTTSHYNILMDTRARRGVTAARFVITLSPSPWRTNASGRRLWGTRVNGIDRGLYWCLGDLPEYVYMSTSAQFRKYGTK